MFDTAAVNALPEVLGTTLGSREGSLLEAFREPEGETTAAVSGFAVNQLAEVGEGLGLGELERLTITGDQKSSIVYVADEGLLTVRADPQRPVANVQTKLEALLAEGESA